MFHVLQNVTAYFLKLLLIQVSYFIIYYHSEHGFYDEHPNTTHPEKRIIDYLERLDFLLLPYQNVQLLSLRDRAPLYLTKPKMVRNCTLQYMFYIYTVCFIIRLFRMILNECIKDKEGIEMLLVFINQNSGKRLFDQQCAHCSSLESMISLGLSEEIQKFHQECWSKCRMLQIYISTL